MVAIETFDNCKNDIVVPIKAFFLSPQQPLRKVLNLGRMSSKKNDHCSTHKNNLAEFSPAASLNLLTGY